LSTEKEDILNKYKIVLESETSLKKELEKTLEKHVLHASTMTVPVVRTTRDAGHQTEQATPASMTTENVPFYSPMNPFVMDPFMYYAWMQRMMMPFVCFFL
jgi:1,2-phenylacetyl-CoA epoxidase catalytic subunit